MVEALRTVPGVNVRKVSDRTFLLHLGGKIEIASKVPLKTRDDLSMAYTPGVARVCMALADHPEDVRRLTIKGNTVAVVTDGSAVLGLGNIGPGAAMPVMEGKAALFKRFADIDAWPICLDTQDVDEIVRTVELIAPGFGGINLEDIAAPRCFEIEARLREKLDIPVFHDDQHGTAIVALAALRNALRVVDKQLEDVRIVVAGGGAAGTAIVNLLLKAGAGQRAGVGPRGHPLARRRAAVRRQARAGPAHQPRGPPRRAAGRPRRCRRLHRRQRGQRARRRGPRPHGDRRPSSSRWPTRPRRSTRCGRASTPPIVASGRSDLPNQINNVLAFPGVFRGLLDARATEITDGMLLAAAEALAAVVQRRPAQRQLHHPQRLRPRGHARGGRRGRRPGPARARRHREGARRRPA